MAKDVAMEARHATLPTSFRQVLRDGLAGQVRELLDNLIGFARAEGFVARPFWASYS